MANQTRNPGFPSFFGNTGSADKIREQFIDGPAEAARGAALGTLIEVAGLLSVLPAAVVASQQRELERLRASRGDDDPRVVELEKSLARAAQVSVTASRGQARLQRAAVAFAETEAVFHGFVSDTELQPLPNLTVRLNGQLTATTGDDGYFRIPLGTTATAGGGIRNLFRGSRRNVAAAEASTEPAPGNVEILAKNSVLHSDPAPVPLDQGRVYREYVIARNPATSRELDNFLRRSAKKQR